MALQKYNIAVVGLWHLGEIYSAGLAELGHRVVGVDSDEKVVAGLSQNIPPLAEPGLVDLLQAHQSSGRLSYSTDFGAVRHCDVVWLTLDTPVDDNDKADPALVVSALQKALPFLRQGVLIAVSSQLPVGTSQELQDLIHRDRPDLSFEYVYVPENLRLSEALECFLKPVRIVIGAQNPQTFEKVEAIFCGLKTDFLRMSPASAEMSKHALNAFLATSLTFAYDIADLCERTGADITDVIRAVRADERIGPKAYLDASVGFSGGTLGRDLQALLAAAERAGVNLPVIDSVWHKNRGRRLIVEQRLRDKLESLAGKTVAILGLTYKPGTSTLRRSLALEIADDLKRAGAVLRLSDPQADPAELFHLSSVFARDPYEAVENAQAVVVAAPWPEFKLLDFKKLAQAMVSPAVFLDGRNFLVEKEAEIKAAGFNYLGIGRACDD